MEKEFYNVNKFENLKEINSKENVEEFHKQRVAFLVVNNEIIFLKNSSKSHLEWAKELGITIDDFNEMTRGFYNDGNIVFYKGNFDYDDKVINDAKKYATKVKEYCNIESAKVFVGVVIGKVGEKWPPKKLIFTL